MDSTVFGYCLRQQMVKLHGNRGWLILTSSVCGSTSSLITRLQWGVAGRQAAHMAADAADWGCSNKPTLPAVGQHGW